MHRVQVRDHHCAFGNRVAIDVCVLRGGAENAEWYNVAESEDLVQDSLHVGHALLVLQRGHPAVGQDAVDLSVHPLFEIKRLPIRRA